MSPTATCQAIVADFAWFSATCGQLAVAVVTRDGQHFYACDEHRDGAA